MLVKNVVKDFLTKGYWARLKKLQEMELVPQVILDGAEENYRNPLSQVSKKSLKEFGEVEIHGFSYPTGKGGRHYVRMSLGVDGGPDILLVPSKWGGWYIYQESKDA